MVKRNRRRRRDWVPDHDKYGTDLEGVIAYFNGKGVNLAGHMVSLPHPFEELEGVRGQAELRIYLEVHAHLGLLQWLSLVKCCVFQQTIPALRALMAAQGWPEATVVLVTAVQEYLMACVKVIGETLEFVESAGVKFVVNGPMLTPAWEAATGKVLAEEQLTSGDFAAVGPWHVDMGTIHARNALLRRCRFVGHLPFRADEEEVEVVATSSTTATGGATATGTAFAMGLPSLGGAVDDDDYVIFDTQCGARGLAGSAFLLQGGAGVVHRPAAAKWTVSIVVDGWRAAAP